MKIRYFFFIALFLFFLFLAGDYLFPLDKERLYKPLSTLIYDKNHNLLRMKLSKEGYWRIRAKNIPPLLEKSVLSFEDKYFYYHFGINPFSIVRAIIQNLKNKRVIGASTISMQVARMMYQRKRTIKNKLIEMFNALQLEWHYTKKEILAFYLNLAPYGGNIEGVKSAAKFYFQKSLDELSIGEIAILTTIPKNPNSNRPDRQKNLKAKRDRVLKLLYKNGVITKDELTRAKKESISSKKLKIPFFAPHFTSRDIFPTGEVITTIELSLQNYITSLLKKELILLKDFNVHNAAAIVLNNTSSEVLAYVGSSDFFAPLGQNDGVMMIRSPGSALKPFIYAKAFEQGLITPQKKLFDIRLFLPSYIPQNFTKKFIGEISAKEALEYSLNIPAVMLNHLLGKNSLFFTLKKAGISSIDKPREYYGDAIALGGCGISLWDIASIYASLANSGVKKEIKFLKDQNLSKEVRLFSKEAAFLVSDILSNAQRSEFSAYWESIKDKPKIAFKTGTSAFSKDLLTIGYTPKYSVAVWFGNFSGEKTDNLTGLHTASYAMFDIFEYLNKKEKLEWFKKPKNVIKKEICADAIEIKECREKRDDWVIKGVEQNFPCEILRPETIVYLLKAKRIDSLEDLKNLSCYQKYKNYKPFIAFPQNGSILTQNRDLPLSFKKIKLQCYSFDNNKTIFWLIDNHPPKKAQSGKIYFKYLPQGSHKIGCLDTKSNLTIHKIILKEE